MNENSYREEKLYLTNEHLIEQEALGVIKNVILQNNAVGTLVGYYDEPLTILSVSDYLLKNLDYSFEQFDTFTKGSLKNLFCGENVSWLEIDRFREIHGAGEGKMLSCDGTPIAVRLYKDESVDSQGVPIWVLSVRVD